MRIKELKEEIEIPKDVNVELKNSLLIIKENQREAQRRFLHPKIEISKDNNKIILITKNPSKREKITLNTFKAHIKNMLKGFTEGFTYKLKVCSGHFPMNVSVENNYLVIKNFYGEKVPRKAKILPNVNIKVEGDIITVTGFDKEAVGQTAANIEQTTRITKRDKRVFQDGIYIIEKADKVLT